jgi:hypothetical protein
VGARILGAGDEAALERFLRPLSDSSMFLLSNLAGAGLVDRGEPGQGTYAAWLEGARVVAVAAHVWNRSLVLQAPVRTAEVVRAAVAGSGRPVGGFVGPPEQVEAARRALALDREPTQYAGTEDRFVLELEALSVPPALRSGAVSCRLAGEGDVERLSRWRVDFAVESLGAVDTPETRESYRQGVLRQARARNLYVLEEDGVPVATTAFNAWAPPAALVGGVYTPPPLRGRSHARAAVAGSLLDAAARGVSRAVLFTANPFARRAYEAIGFRRVGAYAIVLLSRPVALTVEPR